MVFPRSNQHIPQLPELTIDRPRLLKKLQSAAQRKLTLIVAPPGYGKTTLVAQFAQATTLPIVWHSVENREHDIPDLLEHCLDALKIVIPNIEDLRTEIKARTSESAVSVTEYLRRALPTDILYVMDDFHHLIGSSGSEAWLRTFIGGVPTTCHLILIGRSATSLPIIEMIARREVEAIGQQDLRFTFQEINDLAEMAGIQRSATDVHKTISHLNGWPAGTILALQPLPANIEMQLFNGKPGPEALFENLAASLFESQPASLNEFLLASSTLLQMTPAACQTILGLQESASYLREAVDRNLFISQLSGRMVYHPLFRDFLQRHLQAHNPERFSQLHAQAGNWFEANNRLDEAFDHYISAQCWNEAAAIAERGSQTYMTQGKAETVLYWNKHLNRDDLLTPKLHYTAAMIHTDGYQYDQAEQELIKAASEFQDTKDETGLIQVALLRANIQRQRGQYQQAIDQAEAFVDQASVPENMQGLARFILGTAYYELGDVTKALQYLETTLPLWRDIGDTYSLSQLLLSLDVAYMRVGKFVEAAACVQEVVNIQRALGKSPSLAIALNNLGYHYHLLGDYRAALHCFEEGLQVVHHLPNKRAEGYIQWSVGDLQRDRGAFVEAMTAYQKALRVAGKAEPKLQLGILLSIVTLQRWKQEYTEALVSAQDAVKLAQEHKLAVESLRAEVTICAIRSCQEHSEVVIPELERLLQAFEQRQEQIRVVQTLGICAAAALRASDVWAAHQYIKRALNSINHPANLQPLVAEIIHTPELYTYILRHAQRYELLAQELQKLATAQMKIPQLEQHKSKAEALPTYSLRVWALGQDQVERDGLLVAGAAWQADAPRQLFFYLLLKGAASREQIGLVFWPDSSPQEIRSIFHNTIHRARGAVGANVILFEDNLYRINPDVDLWCDVFEFEGLVQQAHLMSPRIAHTENLWRQAVNLYEGDLLPASDTTWSISYRETLHQTYLEALLELGNSAHIRGNIQDAIAIYKRALDVDPYREDIYRALITCYADAGQSSLIPRQLESLIQFFQTELGIGPSAETLSLVQMLLN